MRLLYVVHIVAGSLGLISGYIALYAAKGAATHRKAGIVFVYVMLAMAMAGLSIATIRNVAPAVNVPAALLTSYLVITSLMTVRPMMTASRWLPVGAMMLALIVGSVELNFAVEAIANGGKRNGMPAFPFFLFGFVGLVGGIGDWRMLRSGPLRGAPRIARHLWRMSFALFIAALSFFLGQAKVMPRPIRIPGLLVLPVLAVLVTMGYWLWRVRIRRSLRGLARVGVADAA